MNAQTVTTIVAAVMLLLAVFSASWLNQRSLKDYIDARFDAQRADFKAEIGILRAELANLVNRVERVEGRLDRVERQLEAIFKPVLPKSGD